VQFAGYAAQGACRSCHRHHGLYAVDDDAKDRGGRSTHATIVKSGNMSRGRQPAGGAGQAGRKSALSPRISISKILEMHHRHKVDAPSGTALILGEAVAEGRHIGPGAPQREGARRPHRSTAVRGSIGFATLRAGSVMGEHSVILAGPGERIVLSHHGRRPVSVCARRDQGSAVGAMAARTASIRCSTYSA
jgi:4-hydroxy-tetrahydrodipicolinate reductase